MSTRVQVSKYPKCEFCCEEGLETKALYDGRTVFETWAYMCSEHFERFGLGIGLGQGQELYVKSKDNRTI